MIIVTVKNIRISKELTQSELAKKSGLSQSALSYIESGQKSPTLETLELITNALDVCVKELFTQI